MTDANPPEDEKIPNEVIDELRDLGRNLRNVLQTTWDSEERKKLTKELETGLNELGITLSQATKEFSGSPAGQTLKEDVKDFQERLRTGEVESKVRDEVLGALRMANNELKKVISKDKPEQSG
jgi:hypothetical protein